MDCARKARSEALKSLPSRERGLKYRSGSSRSRETLSLPSRERGLKSELRIDLDLELIVAPFAGAWIEIRDGNSQMKKIDGRSLRGSVD